MRMVVDTHVHFHPCYDAAAFWRQALDRLPSGPDVRSGLCLTESGSCRYFADLREGRAALPSGLALGPAGPCALHVRRTADGRQVWLFAGRQAATKERMEIAALLTEEGLPDGLGLAETADRARAIGAVPLLPWAPGKWMFARAPIARGLLDRAGPELLLIADSSLRPLGWPEPRLMRRARRGGFRILAGSDPLPFAGEERRVAQYCTQAEGAWDDQAPARSLRAALCGGSPLESTGRRSTPFEFAVRLLRHSLRR